MAEKTHCRKGHEYTERNTYRAPKTGAKGCRECRNISGRKYHAAHRGELMFGGNREKAIQRDGEKCVACGLTRQVHHEKYGRDITVDHIDNNGVNKPKHLKNNSLDNLQTLCLRCHASKDNRRKKLTFAQVVNIRHIGDSISRVSVARLYGVHPTYIHQLLNNRCHTEEFKGRLS